MPFVTKLRLTSGDGAVLDRVATDIKESAERKGVELTGPHSLPPERFSVPQYRRCPPGGGEESGKDRTNAAEFPVWQYTVYVREMEIVGREEFARQVTERDLPTSIHLEVEVDRRAGMGG